MIYWKPINRLLSLLIILPFYIFCALLVSSCAEREKVYKESRSVMDTFTTITVISFSKEKAKEAIDAGFAEIEKLDKFLNNFEPESEISTVSKFAGIKTVHVSMETLDLMQKTMSISQITNGAFDPTIAPVYKLWKFSGRPADPSMPDRDSIENALKLVDYRKIKI